ncbi:hypothetical protein [Arthrobacter sp. LAR12-1-1.1]|uniref:hypothetical protein n=1 Tax=Arthrobacter sp. LAR12-1-1.1 TaxID=3135215 RepID=UPI003420CC13
MPPGVGPTASTAPYTSWWLLHHIHPGTEITFRAAMHRRGRDQHGRRLRMAGPGAADHILASHPGGE